MKYPKLSLALIVLPLVIPSSAHAATKAIKVLPAKPLFNIALSGNSGDQVFSVLTTPISLIAVGTFDSSTLGGSDGFISATDFAGVKQWDLRLGGATDDIATAAIKEKSGGFLVAGTCAPALLPPAGTNVDTVPIQNIDSVSVTPWASPNNSLNKLSIWRVSSTGEIQSTFTFDLPGSGIVREIALDKGGYLITGEIYLANKSSYFSLLMSTSGAFSALDTNVKAPPKAPAITTIPAGLNVVKSYLSSSTIKGIPTWKPKSAIPVIIKYTKKGALVSANYLQGSTMKVIYQSGIGIVAITERSDGYGVTII